MIILPYFLSNNAGKAVEMRRLKASLFDWEKLNGAKPFLELVLRRDGGQ
jgi:hypothetical protein